MVNRNFWPWARNLGRIVAIRPPLVPAIEQHLFTYAEPGPEGLIFVRPRGALWIAPTGIATSARPARCRWVIQAIAAALGKLMESGTVTELNDERSKRDQHATTNGKAMRVQVVRKATGPDQTQDRRSGRDAVQSARP